jgi:hypothetical protein
VRVVCTDSNVITLVPARTTIADHADRREEHELIAFLASAGELDERELAGRAVVHVFGIDSPQREMRPLAYGSTRTSSRAAKMP